MGYGNKTIGKYCGDINNHFGNTATLTTDGGFAIMAKLLNIGIIQQYWGWTYSKILTNVMVEIYQNMRK